MSHLRGISARNYKLEGIRAFSDGILKVCVELCRHGGRVGGEGGVCRPSHRQQVGVAVTAAANFCRWVCADLYNINIEICYRYCYRLSIMKRSWIYIS